MDQGIIKKHPADVAIDRAELISMSETVETPAGKFVNCLQEKDTDALDPGEVADRFYAPGIGQIKDDLLSLVSLWIYQVG